MCPELVVQIVVVNMESSQYSILVFKRFKKVRYAKENSTGKLIMLASEDNRTLLGLLMSPVLGFTYLNRVRRPSRSSSSFCLAASRRGSKEDCWFIVVFLF